jgi:hypothetical protein
MPSPSPPAVRPANAAPPSSGDRMADEPAGAGPNHAGVPSPPKIIDELGALAIGRQEIRIVLDALGSELDSLFTDGFDESVAFP